MQRSLEIVISFASQEQIYSCIYW